MICNASGSSSPLLLPTVVREPYGLGLVHNWGIAQRLAFGAFAAVLIVLSVTSNTFVVYAVRHYRPLRKNSNLWLSSLAVTDILMASAVMPFAAYFNLVGAWKLGAAGCRVR